MTLHVSDVPASAPLGEARAEAFAERLTRALNDGALMLMTSIGHRTGLFDTMAGLPPAPVRDIAVAAGLAERYVREWLAVMVTSGVVDYAQQTGIYHLPAEHAACLTRAASPGNLAVTAQFIGIAGGVEGRIVECFRTGAGLNYDVYDRFHEVMAEDSGQTVVAALFDHILPLVPGLTDRLEAGIDVLDVGCGAGRALLTLAERFPRSCFRGVDLCEAAVAPAREQARRQGLGNLTFSAEDLSGRESYGAYDLITAFDAVHDQKDPQGLLDGIARSLKIGGVFLMQDIGGSSHLERNLEHPLAPFLYAVSTLHCTPVSLVQGGPGLGTMWGVELAAEMLARAGFKAVRTARLPHDPVNAYFVAQRCQIST